MTDKELIRQEIERRIKNLEFSLEKNCVEKYSKLDILGNITTLKSILKYIDSLPEEPASEELDTEIAIMWSKSCHLNKERDKRIATLTSIEFTEIARHFAEWGRNHFENKSETVSEDFEEEYEKYFKTHETDIVLNPYTNCKDIARHFTEWQKQQMMKDAVESIVEDWCGDSPEIAIPLNPQDFKNGDKVKLIIIKEDNQ